MTNKPIREHYSHAIADAAKKERREQAEVRQAARDKRSNAKQIAKLNASGYVAKKERARLK